MPAAFEASDSLDGLNIPTDFPRPRQHSGQSGSAGVPVGAGLLEELELLARERRVSLFSIFLSAYNILLKKYTDQDDIVVGAVTAYGAYGGSSPCAGGLSALPLRNRLTAGQSTGDFVRAVEENLLSALAHRQVSFDMPDKPPDGDEGGAPPFDVMLVHRNREEAALPGDADQYAWGGRTTPCDLVLTVTELAQGLHIGVTYRADLFRPDTIDRLASHYVNILRAMAGDPGQSPDVIDMLSPEEREQLLYAFNDTGTARETETCVHERFERQAERTPDAVAVVFEERSVTYGALNQRANQLARRLLSLGVGPNTLVGIMAERSVEMLTAMLAILKAGGAYLPLDTDFPAERIAYMIKDSGTSLLLSRDAPDIPYEGARLDIFDPNLYEGDASNLGLPCAPENLAYVLYTSGSTGNPKGVMISHGALANFCGAMTGRIAFGERDSILSLTTVSFDIFVLETLLPLTRGMRIVLANREQQQSPGEQSRLIRDSGVDMMQATPSRMRMLLARPETAACVQSLKVIMIGGEPLPDELLTQLRSLTRARLYNMYGPTETTVWSAVKDLTQAGAITIGTPVANTRFYVVDKNHALRAMGIPGELCIAGDGVALGYLNRPELTRERFVSNPHEHGGVMYKTGDLVKWLPDGEIAFLGRMDSQVKIRGYRIEIGEIESAMKGHPLVNEAAVIERENADGMKYLCAYITAAGTDGTVGATIAADVKAFLSRTLPDYMIPSFVIVLEKMPLTPNGKMDKKSLPAPREAIGAEAAGPLPRGDAEKLVAGVWKTVLGIDAVHVNDSFFDLGGNSMLAIKAQVEFEKLGIYLELTDIAEHHTLRSLARYIEGGPDRDDTRPDGGETPARAETTGRDVHVKELPGIEPFNEVFYLSCFYNAAFPAVLSFGKSLLPFMANDALVFTYTPGDVTSLRTDIQPCRHLETAMALAGMYFESTDKSDDFIGEVTDSIQRGMPAVVYVDCFHESIRADLYQKKHERHAVLVYGFDRAGQTFRIVEQHHRDNLDYDKRVIGFEDLQNAYNGFVSRFSLQMSRDTIFKASGRTGEADRDVLGGSRRNFAAYMAEKEEMIRGGIESAAMFAVDFESRINDPEWFHDHGEALVVMLNDVIKSKKAELYRISRLYAEEEALRAPLSELLSLWTAVRNHVAKSAYAGVCSARLNAAMIQNLRRIYESEMRCHNALNAFLEKGRAGVYALC